MDIDTLEGLKDEGIIIRIQETIGSEMNQAFDKIREAIKYAIEHEDEDTQIDKLED